MKLTLDKLHNDDKLISEVAAQVDEMSLEAKLEKFQGNSIQHRSIVPSVVMTDGIKFLSDRADTKWIVDLIAGRQLTTLVTRQKIQLWELSKGELKLKDTHNKLILQEVVTREFPLDSLIIWVIDKVMLLDSEVIDLRLVR